MVRIDLVEFWQDVGYMEGDYEIPPVNLAYPVNKPTIYTVNDTVIPPKGHTFSRMQIKARWEDLRHASYLKAEYTWASGEIQVIYGWIDSVTLLSDSADAPMCQVDWHIDYWRTYKGVVDFGAGFIKKRPYFNTPQMSQPIYWEMNNDSVLKFEGDLKMTDGSAGYWLYVAYLGGVTGSTGTSTYMEYYCAPLVDSTIYITDKYNTTTSKGYSLGLLSVLGGTWEEEMGLDPSKIKGAWILPFPPQYTYGKGTSSEPLYMDNWFAYKVPNKNCAYFYLSSLADGEPTSEYTLDIDDQNADAYVVTTDLKKYVITGFDGEIIGELPWGMKVSSLSYRVCFSANSCYMQIRYDIDSHAVGLCYTIPAPVVDTVENATSTYNYSGQRAYDMEMRQIGVYSQIAGSSTNAIGGAIAGGTSGGGAAGAVAGAVVGLGTSLIGAGLNQHVFNPMIQEAKDTLVSKQSTGLLLSGSTIIDTVWHGKTPRLACLKADSASEARYNANLTRYGYECNRNVASCEAIIKAGGPLQIQDLVVAGNAPVEAKVYIKSLFARGVNITLK